MSRGQRRAERGSVRGRHEYRRKAAQEPRATKRVSRREREPPPVRRNGGERERRCADKRGDAAEHRGGAGLTRGQQRAERGSGRGKHEHRRTYQRRYGRRLMPRAAGFGSRRARAPANAARSPCATPRASGSERELRQHGEPAASKSAATRTNAAAQPSAEEALACAAASGEQSEGWVEECASIDERSTDAMGEAACISHRA